MDSACAGVSAEAAAQGAHAELHLHVQVSCDATNGTRRAATKLTTFTARAFGHSDMTNFGIYIGPDTLAFMKAHFGEHPGDCCCSQCVVVAAAVCTRAPLHVTTVLLILLVWC